MDKSTYERESVSGAREDARDVAMVTKQNSTRNVLLTLIYFEYRLRPASVKDKSNMIGLQAQDQPINGLSAEIRTIERNKNSSYCPELQSLGAGTERAPRYLSKAGPNPRYALRQDLA
ncbi:hypothetical protein RRG08_028952 [Elysia crispata]|uniref:Uncharacterized protein n=1 Tax=Elysia crispata TaxID=231223 RepID=A0AAE1E2B3_9GAST|nr:hypothetical protein RRG08_028952 [Elysia crispata]